VKNDDLETFRLSEDDIKAYAKSTKPATGSQPRRRHDGRFVLAPKPWINDVAKLLDSVGELEVVLEVLFLGRFNDGQRVAVTAAAMRDIGISSWVRNHALRKLEAVGMARIEWRGNAAPLVTLLTDRTPSPPWGPALNSALDAAVCKTDTWWWRPADLLAALKRPPDYDGDWPENTRQLRAMLRQIRPGSVVRRGGLGWLHLRCRESERKAPL
jgi:hypothetical protein